MTSLVYEGILYVVWPKQQGAGRVLVRMDYATLDMHFRNEHGRDSKLNIPEVIAMFQRLPHSPHGMLAVLGDATEAAQWPDAEKLLRHIATLCLSEPGVGIEPFLPHITRVAPGIAQMKSERRCEGANFSPVGGLGVDLSGADLSDVAFKGVDFSPANLARTVLMRTSFEDCRFGRDQLAGLRLDGARLIRMMWSDLNLTGTVFDGAVFNMVGFQHCDFTDAKLRNIRFDTLGMVLSILTRTILDGAEGKDAIFAGSTLSHASFVGARIEGSTFAGATLTDTSFKDAVMQGALFAATPSYDFPAASFNNVDFDNTDLTAADLSGFVLTGKIRYARPPRFGQSVTTRTLLRRSTFSSTFLGKDCSYIDASDAHITVEPSLAVDEFKAVHAILPAMGFANLELNDADFTSAQIKDARFGNCKLKDAKFNSAVLEGADFTKADLMGADFSDANLISAQFTSAWLSSATFHQTLLGSTNFSSAVLAQVNFGAIRSRSLAGVSFSRACLVSADFKDVVSTVAGSLATSFSEACLAGADFGGAQLPDAILTNAQVSAAQGKIRVVHPHRTEEFSYGPTTLLPASTGSRTTCPDGKFGPCDASRLHLKPVPAEWKP